MVHPHSNLVRQIDNISVNTSALAAVTGIAAASKIDAARLQGFRTLMQRGIMQLHNSDGSGGPLAVYMTADGLNLAETEEAIENDPQSSQDEPANEQAHRRIYLLGYLQRDASGGGAEWFVFNTRHKFSVIEGIQMNYVIYNTNTAAAMDAANSVSLFVEHLGVWLRD